MSKRKESEAGGGGVQFVDRESLPDLPTPDIAAILCSDLHLSHRPPLLRSAEESWYAAQARPLVELRWLAERFNNCPVVCGGDVFDDGWRMARCPPELINFAIDNLPHMFAIPGQHDLVHHRLDELEKSAFWTLVRADKITYLRPGGWVRSKGVKMRGFPWGVEPERCDERGLTLAVIHRYVWSNASNCYPGADEFSRVQTLEGRMGGYSAVLSGDNHCGFYDGWWFNAGGFMRRKSDELGYNPQVGLLHESGQITPYRLDTSQDVYADPDALGVALKRSGAGFDASEFVDELESLGETTVDFVEAVMQALKSQNLAEGVRRRILEALR